MDTDEELRMNLNLINHRLKMLEEERLPHRVAIMEPVVKRVEEQLDDISEQMRKGLNEVRDAINDQRSLQKGMVFAVAAVVGIIQLLPFIKGLLT
jgi:signal transduction histidine kinase